MEDKTCDDCGKQVDYLDAFPGKTKKGCRCMDCHAAHFDKQPLTHEGLMAMTNTWRNVAR